MPQTSPVPGDPEAPRGYDRVLESGARSASAASSARAGAATSAHELALADLRTLRRVRTRQGSIPRERSSRNFRTAVATDAAHSQPSGAGTARSRRFRGPRGRPYATFAPRSTPRSPGLGEGRGFGLATAWGGRERRRIGRGERTGGIQRQNFTFLRAHRASKAPKIASIGFGPASPRIGSVGGGHPGAWNRASEEQRELLKSSGEAGGLPRPHSGRRRSGRRRSGRRRSGPGHPRGFRQRSVPPSTRKGEAGLRPERRSCPSRLPPAA
jgi:hypothetical protein